MPEGVIPEHVAAQAEILFQAQTKSTAEDTDESRSTLTFVSEASEAAISGSKATHSLQSLQDTLLNMLTSFAGIEVKIFVVDDEDDAQLSEEGSAPEPPPSSSTQTSGNTGERAEQDEADLEHVRDTLKAKYGDDISGAQIKVVPWDVVFMLRTHCIDAR